MSVWHFSDDAYTIQDVKKVVVVGDACCGKTSLIQTFLNWNDPACEVDPSLTKYQTNIRIGNVLVQTVVLDLSFNEDSALRTWFYKEAHAVIICFSLNHPPSYSRAVDHWVKEVKKCLPGVPIVLAGLKKDCRLDGNRKKASSVPYIEAFKAAAALNLERYIESSVVSGEGVYDVFTSAAFATLNLPELLAFHKLHFCS